MKISLSITVPKLCSRAPWGTRVPPDNLKFQGKRSNSQHPLGHRNYHLKGEFRVPSLNCAVFLAMGPVVVCLGFWLFFIQGKYKEKEHLYQ